MGANKALLRIGSETLIEKAAGKVALVTAEVVVSADDPALYAFVGVPVVPDQFAGQGPLAGLHAGMSRSSRSLVLLLACDLPLISEAMLRVLIESCEGYDAVIPRTSEGGLHPLCGVYRRTCLPDLEANLRRGVNKMTSIFDGGLTVRWLDASVGTFSDQELWNVNTPQDLARLRAMRPENDYI